MFLFILSISVIYISVLELHVFVCHFRACVVKQLTDSADLVITAPLNFVS